MPNAHPTAPPTAPRSTDLIAAALRYAELGYPVFPVEPRGKRPLGRLAPHGLRDATASPERIRQWWAAAPDANIGLAVPAGVVVLDVDGAEGRASVDGETLPPTPTAQTGCGAHYWYRLPDGATARNGAGLRPGLDVRALGGYVVAPPSVHPSGHRYAWAPGLALGEVPLAEAPDWLANLLRERTRPEGVEPTAPPADHAALSPYVEAALRDECARVASAPVGTRNSTLNAAAYALGQLVGAGLLDELQATDGLAAAAAACGLPRAEAETTIRSGLTAGRAEPRDLSQVRILKPAEPSGVEPRPTPSKSEATALPIVNTGDRQLSDLTGQALQVLHDANDPPVLYVRSGAVVRVRRDEEGRPIIDKAGPEVIVERMGKVATWVLTKTNGKAVAARPPQHVAVNILAGGVWPFPALQGIAEAPFLRPDGSVVTRPGYDPATKLLYIPTPGLTVPPIPAKPTQAEITQALDAVWTPISEFPFADDASMAGALAMMLSPIMRPAIRGCTPMALVDAPQAGTGKSLLTEVVSLVSTGRAAAMLSAPDTDAEWEKRITAVLAGGATFICIDNIEQPLSAPSLAKVLTSETHQGRILGESTMVNLPQRATWVGTGNNISLRGDLARRCYWVRLDAASSRPWTREGFRIPDLRQHIADHRGELLAALLTLARAWFDAGCPRPTTPRLGSYEAWCDAIGGTLELAGVPAFLGNIEDLWNRDDDAQEWEAFLRAWFAQFGDEPQTVREVADTIDGISAGELREALPATLINQSGEVNRRSFGRQLAKRAEMRFGDDGIHIRKAKTDRCTQKPRWQVAMS